METQIINKIKNFDYSFSDNSLSVKSKDDDFESLIEIKPFYLLANIDLDELNLERLLKENSFFLDLIGSEILNNQNLNAQINIDLEKIKNVNYLEKIKLRTFFEEGNIYFKDTRATWNNSVSIKVNETQLLNENNNIKLIGSIIFDFINIDKVFNYYQIKKNHRNKIEKIKFDFMLNLNENKIQLDNVKIDNTSNNEISAYLNDFNSKNNNLPNKVIFRNFIKNFFKYYDEG